MQGWSKQYKIFLYVVLIVCLVFTVFAFTLWRSERIIERIIETERVVEVPITTIKEIEVVKEVEVIKEVEVLPLEVQNQLDALMIENAVLEQQITGYEEGQIEAQNQIVGLEAIIIALNQQIAEYEQVPTPVITLTDVVGTITGQEALDLIKAACPKTSLAGGLRAVEFTTADLVSVDVFKAWLAQDKTEDEVLGDSWDYISALEYKLRLQPGGQDVPFNRARVGAQTLAAVVLYDSVDGAARLYIFDPLNEEGMRKISPANPDQIIEYVHLD